MVSNASADTSPRRPAGIRDEDLVAKMREGDVRAMDGLFRRHGRAVAGLAARLLGSTQDVDDVVHDTFLTAFVQIADLRDDGAFRPWVTQIAVNKVRRRFRRRRIEHRLGLHRGGDDATLAELAAGDAGQEARAELAKIDEVLRRMPESQRIAWMLHYVEGYTLSECVELCGCSRPTLKRWIAKARKRIEARARVKEPRS